VNRLHHWRRTARVWRLTVRNGSRYAFHLFRRFTNPKHKREELDQQFAIRTSEDVARELGNMKGALMKFGQLLSFIVEALPDDAQQALATLQSDAKPMAPALAAKMVTEELGHPPEKVFLDWQPLPVAAASVGQVHRAVTRDGREVARHRVRPRQRRGVLSARHGLRPEGARRQGPRRRAALTHA
jgi:predicted unusual protein kinase regulating ubiquinone biosynthesis (AarF/ABC1/UbiB family)